MRSRGAPPTGPCFITVEFHINSPFDDTSKKYTAFVSGTQITGTGLCFSDKTEPLITPASSRIIPLDGGGVCLPALQRQWNLDLYRILVAEKHAQPIGDRPGA